MSNLCVVLSVRTVYGYFNGGLSSAFAWDCNKNRDEIVRLINAVAWEGNSGVLSDKVDGQLVWR